jgi:hypothetical protein
MKIFRVLACEESHSFLRDLYGFGGDCSDPDEVERQFMDNIVYLEYYCRNLGLEKKGLTLAQRISALFDRLPDGCDRAMTDDREGMIRAVVAFRNRTAHGKYDTPRPTCERLLALTVKIATLLFLNDALDESGPGEALRLSKRGSPYLRTKLALSDKPDSPTP